MLGIKVVLSKYSKSSCDDIGQLFKVMFPDSKVAESFSCVKTKSRYIVSMFLNEIQIYYHLWFC